MLNKVIYVNGYDLVKYKKTGVEFFHWNILKNLKNEINYEINLMSSREINLSNVPEWIKRNLKIKKNKSILSYILPYSFFFKTDLKDIYIIDGRPIFLDKKIKKIGIIHDLMTLEYPENYSVISKIVTYIFFKQCKKFDRIITVSETTKNKIHSKLKIDKSKIDVVYPGVNFGYMLKEQCESIKEYKWNNVEYILYVGALRKNKNLEQTIKIFFRYKKEFKDKILKFLIAGAKNNEYENLKKLVKELSLEREVIFLGYISDEEKNFLYKNAKAFIFLSKEEGFGIPLIEAMNFKIPVLASNIEIFKEITKNKYELANIEDENEVYNLFIKLLQDEEKRNYLIKKGIEICNYYTWENTSKKFLDVINNCEG